MSLHPLLLLPSRPRLSRRRLHPPRPHTRRRMTRDTPLSPLSRPASTNILYLLRPSRLMRRPPVLTPRTPTYRNTFGSCSLLHFRRPTCRLPWPQTLRTSLSRIRTFLRNRRLTSGSVTSWSTTSTQPMRLLYGNHLVEPPLASGTAENDLVAEMLAAGVIESSDSSWASPVCLAKKPDGLYRFCVDYRRVNAVSRKDAYPIPDIQDAFDSLRGRNTSRPLIFFRAIGK